jgi:hypothetical protein
MDVDVGVVAVGLITVGLFAGFVAVRNAGVAELFQGRFFRVLERAPHGFFDRIGNNPPRLMLH